MEYNRRPGATLGSCCVFSCLLKRSAQIQGLLPLDLDVQPRNGAHHIGISARSRELLAAPRIEAPFPQKGRKLQFASLALLLAICPPGLFR